MKIDYFEIERISGKMLLIADKKFYGESITEREEYLLELFKWLNPKKEVEQNIENFCELLHELDDYLKGGGNA